MKTIGVVIATYGDPKWKGLVVDRSRPSVTRQTRTADAVEIVHGKTLAEARNQGVELIRTEFVIVLDADDELDPGYLEAMAAAAETEDRDCIFQPSTVNVSEGVANGSPVLRKPRGKSLLHGNHIVVGAMFRRDQFVRLGGFAEWEALEDWDLWLSMWVDGAHLKQVPDAVYRVHESVGGRNDLTGLMGGRLFREIRKRHVPSARAKGLA